MPERLTLFFDGGCRPNPGPMEAMVVARGRTYYRADFGSGDNNEAEWLALLFAVEIARLTQVADVLFIGDSSLIVEQAAGRQRCRSLHLQPYLVTFQKTAGAIARVRLRRVARSKNLAGIALARRTSAPAEAVLR